MYDEDKQDKTVENINENIKDNEIIKLQQENETLQKMVENRNQELKKPESEETKREYLIKLSNALGITQQREEIDKLNTSVTYIAERMAEDRNSINEILGILKNPTGAAIPTEKADPMQKIEALSQIITPLMDAYKTFKSGNENIVQPLISQEVIN